MTTLSEEEQTIHIEDSQKNMKDMQINDANMDEQENIENDSSPTSEGAEICADVEEGELPEEGEIMDEDDEATLNEPHTSTPTPEPKQTSLLETPKADIQSTSQTDTPSSPPTVVKQSQEPIEQDTPASPPETEENRKKRGPSSPLGDPYASSKRPALSPNAEYGNAPQLPPRRRQAWTEAVLCKFFREGYCRDGEACAYSHNAAHSNRKPELCKFYQQGFCKKGLACTLLHGEYPCKAFHEGKCDKNPCKYSHMPLNDYTRVIFEQMVQDEALAAKIVIPQQPARRKVLLRRPLANTEPRASPPLKPSPRRDEPISVHEPPNNAIVIDNDVKIINEPPPAVAPTAPFVALTAAQDPDELLVAEEAAYMGDNQSYQNYTAPSNAFVAPVTAPSGLNGGEDPSGFSISDMIDNIKNPVPVNNSEIINLDELMSSSPPKEKEVIPDTPASPPKTARNTVYRLVPIAEALMDFEGPFWKKITSVQFREDPRVQSIIQKQFDYTSNMFGQNMPLPPQSQIPSKPIEKPAMPAARDPRARPADPRQRPVQQIPINDGPPGMPINGGPPEPTQNIVLVDDDPHFKSLVQKQLQMVNQYKNEEGNGYQQQYEERPPSSRPRPRDEGDYYNDRREYDRGYSERGYSDRNYDDRRYDDSYQGYDESDPRYRSSSSRYPPRGSSSRGSSSRGYHDDRYPPRRQTTERFDSRWDSRGEPSSSSSSYRRDTYRDSRDRRDYPRSSGSTRHRERSRSRTPPRKPDPPVEERPMTLREKRKNNEYQSPLARA